MTEDEFKVNQEILDTPGIRPLPVNSRLGTVTSKNVYKVDEYHKNNKEIKDMRDKKSKKVNTIIRYGIGIIVIVSAVLIGGTILKNVMKSEKTDNKDNSKVSSVSDIEEKPLLKEEKIKSLVSNTEVDNILVPKEESLINNDTVFVEDSSQQTDVDDVSSDDLETIINEESADINNSDLSFESESDKSNVVFEVGTSSDIEDSLYYLNNTIQGYFIRYYSEVYGVDPNLVLAVCFQESGGVNLVGEGSANGPMMLEVMGDYDITVYNYSIGDYETITVSSDYTHNEEYNFKCAIANLRNKIDYCDGNIYAALQGYNFNEVTLMNALDQNGYVLNGYNDYKWLYITEDLHNNPQKYGIDWPSGKKYGVANYPVYTGYHLPNEIITYNYKDKEITMNYATAEILNIKNIEYHDEMVR